MSIHGRADTDQFVALAGLRGVAALVVVQWHGKIFLGGDILPAGYLAVDFFFLLSGWVLAHAYDKRLDSGMTAGQFMRLRLIRTYPLYLLALSVAAAVALVSHHLDAAWLLASLVLLPDFWQANFYWMIPPTWSLVAEFAANLPFAIFHRALSTRALAAVVAVSFLGLVVTTVIWGNLNQGHSGLNSIAMLPRVFFSFPLGTILYRHRAALAARAPRWSTWPSVGALLLALAIPSFDHDGARDLLIVSVGLPTLLLFASNAARAGPTARTAVTLGAMSYPLYLLHVPLFEAVETLVFRPLTGGRPASTPGLFVAGFMIALIAIALLVDRYFDVPVRRWLTAGSGQPVAPNRLPRVTPAAP